MIRRGLMIGLLFFAAMRGYAQDDITFTPLATPAQSQFGALTYQWGYTLESSNANFGGFSSLAYMTQTEQGGEKKQHLVTVTDAGFITTLTFNDQTVSATALATNLEKLFTDLDDDGDKLTGDAEAVMVLKDSIYVALEQDHRVLKLNTNNAHETLPMPSNINLLPHNGGIEGMTVLNDTMFFILAELPAKNTNQQIAWVATKHDNGLIYEARTLLPPKGFYPSDATTLANGDVLVLLRAFSFFGGFQSKIWRISQDTIMSGKPITGEIIASFKNDTAFGNLEGIANITMPNGDVALYVISDNNFNRFQKTYFVKFLYSPKQIKTPQD